MLQLTARFADYHLLQNQVTRDNLGSFVAGTRHQQFPATTRHANAVVDLVAVAENFTVIRFTALHPEVHHDEISSWPKRERAWLEHSQWICQPLPIGKP